MSRNEEALNRFIEQIGEIRERLVELQQYVDNHMNFDPEAIHWGHVGTAGHFLKELTELADIAYDRGEYAKEEQPPKKSLTHDQNGFTYFPVSDFEKLVQSAKNFAVKKDITPERLEMWPTSFFEDWVSEIKADNGTLAKAWRKAVDPNFS